MDLNSNGSRVVDFRSDTVTRPTPAMRKAMAEADVGDVVFGDDPTVNRLEAAIAERCGMEAALFVPSGTMSNQIALGTIGGPGDAILVPELAHVARWEGSGAAASFGVHLALIADGAEGAEDDAGLPPLGAFERHLYFAHVKAPRVVGLSLENTHNWAGGRVHSAEALASRTAPFRERGLHAHLDGARVLNAAVALAQPLSALAAPFDSISVCFSKGLGAPIGSALVGSRDFIGRADRVRHRLGGAWRQAGILAAAALHALDHHVERLADDHARARALADALVRYQIGRPLHPVDSNIVQFEVHPRFGDAACLVAAMKKHAIWFFPTGVSTGRLVTHLDVTDEDIARTEKVWEQL